MLMIHRLEMELSNQKYFTENEYIQFLSENDLECMIAYDKKTHQKRLLLTALDVLEAVSNDIDIMRRVETEFSNTSQAYKFLDMRIQSLREKIATIPEPEEEYSCFSLMYTN